MDLEYEPFDNSVHHVTVQIYSGLSHAYLNMIAFLPEASHAIDLCCHWTEGM